jgi:D-arabinose 1-dehydrogenase-like Zn-dependent alcohol dehydrogenase
MAEATRMAETGQLRVRLNDRRFTLENVDDAYRVVAEGLAAGKVVIDVKN